MPQARNELREIFDSDADAIAILDKHGIKDDRFCIMVTEAQLKNKEIADAVEYLCDEWDWDYKVIGG